MINVTVWNECRRQLDNPAVTGFYPQGIHQAVIDGIAAADLHLTAALLDDAECGLPQDLLNQTDVLVWWGHIAHHEVPDELAYRIRDRVWNGMGLVVLHSGHYSKIFQLLNGTSCRLHWREANEKERIWCIDPTHPVAAGLPETFTLEHEETYGEPFMIAPDGHTVFQSWFKGGETFRSGVALQRENGRIFYFQPGHESCPSLLDENVLKIIGNAVRWCAGSSQKPYPEMCIPKAFENDGV